MSIDLRPLKLGELLDRAFSLFRQHFALFVGIMAVPSVLGVFVAVPLQFLQPQTPPKPGELPDFAQLMPYLTTIGVGVAVLVLIYWVVYMLALGATTAAVAEVYDGRTPTIAGAYARVRPRIGRLALLWLIASLRLGGAFVGLFAVAVVPMVGLIVTGSLMSSSMGAAAGVVGALIFVFGSIGVMIVVGWLALRYAVSVPAVMLEEVTAGGAITRSRELTRGFLWRVFVLVLFSMVLTYMSLAVFQGPFLVAAAMAGTETPTGFWLQLIGLVSGAVGGMLTAPVLVIGFVVLYYDLRVRKEAFDLSVMMGALDTPAGAPPPLAPPPTAG